MYLILVLLTNMTNQGIFIFFSKTDSVENDWFYNEVYENHKCYSTFPFMLRSVMLTIRSNDKMVSK
jgi:hypothetical protein